MERKIDTGNVSYRFGNRIEKNEKRNNMCIINFIVAMIPGILWMWYIYRSDKFEPEPLGKIIMVFLGGFFAVLPIALIEVGISAMLGISGDIDTIYEAVSASWFVAGILEELTKFGVVLFAVYYSKEFDEPIDGIVYSSAAALGFASLENFLYMSQMGIGVILIRGPLSTLGHLLFSAFWGYGLGRGKFHPKIAKQLTISGLLLAAGAHGLFNFFLMSSKIFSPAIGSLLAFMVIPLVIGLWILLVRKIRKDESISPFNPHRKPDELDEYDDSNEIA
ncbi:PrsW family intramembrane metalloprotease [bacterium]|nr:PrsW family intramembrane metalloprotease [bacterium]